MSGSGRYRTDEEFQKDLEYGKFAERKVADFLVRNGWSVKYAEDYGEMYDDEKYMGPRVCFVPPWVSSSATIEEIEVSCMYLIAPDILARKKEKLELIEVKRRGRFSQYRGKEVFYINKKQYDDYSAMNLYFAPVYLFLYISENDEDENYETYWASLTDLDANIQYRANDYYGFSKRILTKINIG